MTSDPKLTLRETGTLLNSVDKSSKLAHNRNLKTLRLAERLVKSVIRHSVIALFYAALHVSLSFQVVLAMVDLVRPTG